MAIQRQVNLITRDGRVDAGEIDTYQPAELATALEQLDVVRTVDYSLGGNVDFVDIPGIGKWTQDPDSSLNPQESFGRWLKARMPGGGWVPSSTNPDDAARATQSDLQRVLISGEDEQKVAADIQGDAESISPSSGGSRGALVALAIGVVAVAVAVIGGT